MGKSIIRMSGKATRNYIINELPKNKAYNEHNSVCRYRILMKIFSFGVMFPSGKAKDQLTKTPNTRH